MSLKSNIVKNRRIDKFVGLLGNTINTLFWLSPAIGGIYNYSNEGHLALTILAGVAQLGLTGLQINMLGENHSPNWGYPIKKLFKSIPNNILNNKYRDLIIQHRVGGFNESDIEDIANHYLYSPQLCKIQSYPYVFGTEGLKEEWYELSHLKEIDNILKNYQFSEREEEIMSRVKQEHMKNSHLFILEHTNSDSAQSNAYMKRTQFILQEPYTLKEKDYESIISYFKKPRDSVNIDFFLTHENIRADWKYLKRIFLKTYLVENEFYQSIVNILDGKSEEKHDNTMSAAQKAAELKDINSGEKMEKLNTVLCNETLFNHVPIFYAEKWETIKENFNYLNNSAYIEEFNNELLESLPLLINHDRNLNFLKSEKAKEETKKYLSSILDILIEQSNKHIELLELSRTKDLKILHKYSKMAK